MKRYVFTRVIYMIITFIIIATFTFFLMQTLPGSPFNDEELSEFQKEQLNERYGLNDPLPKQYINYMFNLAKGDLGISFQYDGRPVVNIIKERIKTSAYLGFQALVFGTLIGLALGIVAAIYHNTLIDYFAIIIAVLGLSIPSFVFAGLLQYWIGVRLEWLPVAFWRGFDHTILPTIALAAFVIATMARYIRTEMLEVLTQDYILTAKAKGLDMYKVINRHGLRNAMIPIITILGPLSVTLITGTLVVEKIFSIPGLGSQFVDSILTNDYPVIMGVTLLYSALFIFIVFVADLLYGILDPRIRLSGGNDNGT